MLVYDRDVGARFIAGAKRAKVTLASAVLLFRRVDVHPGPARFSPYWPLAIPDKIVRDSDLDLFCGRAGLLAGPSHVRLPCVGVIAEETPVPDSGMIGQRRRTHRPVLLKQIADEEGGRRELLGGAKN